MSKEACNANKHKADDAAARIVTVKSARSSVFVNGKGLSSR